MKLHLDKEEVRQVLCGYATATLHIASNRMEMQDDGSAILSYDAKAEPERVNPWTRLWAWVWPESLTGNKA